MDFHNLPNNPYALIAIAVFLVYTIVIGKFLQPTGPSIQPITYLNQKQKYILFLVITIGTFLLMFFLIQKTFAYGEAKLESPTNKIGCPIDEKIIEFLAIRTKLIESLSKGSDKQYMAKAINNLKSYQDWTCDKRQKELVKANNSLNIVKSKLKTWK